ncbi:MAG TPA: PAS domain-containing protein, partial [Bryobacteraceae bacterium]|nr:PAS domain-containing protein [Bryobacteraceae bacterium]
EGRPEGILIFSEDITHLKEAELTKEKRMEDLLHQREGELNKLSDNAQDVIVRFDRDLRYTYVNARVEKETGLPQETMLGKTPSELRLPEPVVDIVTRSVRRVFETGQPNVAELSYPSPGGVTDWEASFSPEFGKSGAVQSVLNIARDITEKNRLAKVAQSYVREIQALAASLMTAQEEERRRVSRELHDQICQQLASLAFDIGGLMTSPLPPKNVQAELKAIQARIVKVTCLDYFSQS